MVEPPVQKERFTTYIVRNISVLSIDCNNTGLTRLVARRNGAGVTEEICRALFDVDICSKGSGCDECYAWGLPHGSAAAGAACLKAIIR